MNTVISIILFLIILIALYHVYYYVNPQLLVDASIINLNQSPQLEIPLDSTTDPAGFHYFYDGWLRVNQVQNSDKNLILFSRGSDFVVSLKAHQLSVVDLSDSSKINSSDGTWDDASNTTVTTISTNFPFQKWVYFCINVEGNQIDTYLDGKLMTSVKGKDIPNKATAGAMLDFTDYAKAESKLKVGSKYITGSLARFRREPGNMDTQSVWNSYMLGPGVVDNGDMDTPDYHARISLLRNNKPRRMLNLF